MKTVSDTSEWTESFLRGLAAEQTVRERIGYDRWILVTRYMAWSTGRSWWSIAAVDYSRAWRERAVRSAISNETIERHTARSPMTARRFISALRRAHTQPLAGNEKQAR